MEQLLNKNVSLLKGNCLYPETFTSHLSQVQGIIHCVGTLIEKKGNPDLSYKAMNRDSCINMAKELNQLAQEAETKYNFVMISNSKSFLFMPEYQNTKEEA